MVVGLASFPSVRGQLGDVTFSFCLTLSIHLFSPSRKTISRIMGNFCYLLPPPKSKGPSGPRKRPPSPNAGYSFSRNNDPLCW